MVVYPVERKSQRAHPLPFVASVASARGCLAFVGWFALPRKFLQQC